ncbi:MAG TPA: YgeY family selenium metabolism-linked hydrolase, partial [Acetomicrobium sp.]|nr:YgeY family selenium metabolism-linked hydrolase [Acetomicrobium sp.]
MELRKEILKKAESYRPLISKFLRDIIALPSQSSNEGAVVNRIAQEMEKMGFDRIDIDPMGNILGYVGNG